MNLKHLPAGCIPALMLLVSSPALDAQNVPASTAAAAEEEDEAIVLSPFVVDASEDADSYAAKATLAGTRIRTELKNVGSSISVITEKFLEDTNSSNAEDLLVYTPNTEVSGQGGNFLGRGDGKFLTGVNLEVLPTTRVRGLAEADNTRDFFLTDIPWDSYNTGRIDLQRGPNSILFGIGSPAGIVNSSPNQASFADSNKIEAQFGSYGSVRYTADLNRALIPDEFAVRVSILRDDTKYRQDPTFRDDHRVYGALRWDPGVLSRGSARTSLRMSFEKGNIDANMPRNTPPLDAISLWYTDLNKQVLDPSMVNLGMRSTAPALGGVGANTSLAGKILFSVGGAQGGAYMEPNDDLPAELYYLPLGVATFDQYAIRSRLPGYTIDAWKARSLTDRTVFDYYNHLLEGPNNFQFTDFEAFNAALSQTFFDENLGLELAYDRQEVYSGGFNYFEDPKTASVTLDILTNLPFGASNPDLRRPMTATHGGYGQWSTNTRENWRATAFGELDFGEIAGEDSWIGRVFGRNVFTGLASRQETNSLSASYKGFHTEQPFISIDASDDFHTADFYTDDLFFYTYLGAPISASSTSASGLNLQGIKGRILPQSTTILAYNYATGRPETIAMPVVDNASAPDIAKKYRGGNKSFDRVDSTAIVWQGYWLDGSVIPMFGYRTDEQEFRNAGAPPTYGQLNQYRDIYSPTWTLPATGSATTVNSKTFSLVTHLPDRMRDKLPGRLDVSLIYNESENVRPGAGRSDVYGNQVDDPTGKTKEYGIALTGLDDKVTLKVVRYDTKVKNATVADAISTEYWYMAFTDSWGQWGAYAFRDHAGDSNFFQSSRIYGTSSDGHAVTWLPDGPPKAAYTQAEIDATWAKQNAAVTDWFLPENQLPESVVEHWGLLDYHDPLSGFPRGTIPGGLSVTGDTVSEGYEIELIANPMKGLNVSFNASKTSAKRTSLAQSFVDFVESRWEVFQGPAGDMRYWATSTPELGFLPAVDDRDDPVNGVAHGSDGWSARGHFRRSVMSGYWLFRALEESDVPELRPWAFNVVADYAFQEGGLRGLNIGGSYRWQDRSVIGFPVVMNPDGSESYDVSRPYHGSTQGTADLWIGYRRKINDRLAWRAQLNIRNAFANDHLARVTAQPDGEPAAYRIPEPRTWAITNTIEF